MKFKLNQSFVDILHGGYKEHGRVVGVHEDFVTNGNGFDFSVRIVSGDVSLDPRVCKGSAFGCSEELLVGEVDGHFDSGSG